MNELRHHSPRAGILSMLAILTVALALLLSLILGAIAGSSSNPTFSQPIEVDGEQTGGNQTTYSAASSLGYASGSLYQVNAKDPKATNLSVFGTGVVVGQKGSWLIGMIESRLITPSSADGQTVISVPVTVSSKPTTAYLLINNAGGGFSYAALIDGTTYSPVSKSGILAAASFTSTFFGSSPHLVIEFAVPLGPGKLSFRNGDIAASWFSPVGSALPAVQIAEAYVAVDTSTKTTTSTNDQLPLLIDMSVPATVGLNKQGNVPITVLTTAFFDAQTVNVNSVRLFAEGAKAAGYPGAPVIGFESGDPKANGGKDLKLYFSTTDMINLGGFVPGANTIAVLEGSTLGTPPTQIVAKAPIKTTP